MVLVISVVTKFDGEKIQLPEQLRGAAPADVLIVYPAEESKQTSKPEAGSIWDVVGKAPRLRSTADIHAQVRAERDSWDEP